MEWSATALLFPGQGSQVVGMGKDFAENFPLAQQTFEEADTVLGYDLSKLCFEGPAEELNLTLYTQPALYVSSIAILRVLQDKAGKPFVPVCAAGHSLGELTALTAAGSLAFNAGVRLVHQRADAMHHAGDSAPGGMAAILGMERAALETLCASVSEETGKPLVVANDNCPGQIVISGHEDALEIGMARASSQGAKRVVRLAVSIAAHSPLMQIAEVPFQAAVEAVHLEAPQFPVYTNASAAACSDVDILRADLAKQLTNPVRWTETIQTMLAAGVNSFVEIGSGDVLTNLIKRIDRSSKRFAINSVGSLEQFLAE